MKIKHFLLAAAAVAMTTAATADDGIWTISTPQADGKYQLRRDAAYQGDIITTHTRQARIRDDSHMGTVAGRYRGSPGVFSHGRRLYQAETNDRNPTAGFFRANGRRIDTHSGATRHSGSSDYTISYATVNIDARIEGNGFTGGDRQPVLSKGHFYGANAAEQGGIFYDSRQEVSGSFGAKKDDTALQPPAPPAPRSRRRHLARERHGAELAAARRVPGRHPANRRQPPANHRRRANRHYRRTIRRLPRRLRLPGQTVRRAKRALDPAERRAPLQNRSYAEFAVSGTDNRDNYFGYLVNAGNSTSRHITIFSQRRLTENIPTGGSAEYKGEAVLGWGEWLTTGHARLSADFAAKTLHGRIESEARTIGHQVADAYSGATRPRQPRYQTETIHFNPVIIDARIDGNAFSTGADSIVRSKDHFYGEGAAEVGGIFHDSSQDVSGSFGAQKQ